MSIALLRYRAYDLLAGERIKATLFCFACILPSAALTGIEMLFMMKTGLFPFGGFAETPWLFPDAAPNTSITALVVGTVFLILGFAVKTAVMLYIKRRFRLIACGKRAMAERLTAADFSKKLFLDALILRLKITARGILWALPLIIAPAAALILTATAKCGAPLLSAMRIGGITTLSLLCAGGTVLFAVVMGRYFASVYLLLEENADTESAIRRSVDVMRRGCTKLFLLRLSMAHLYILGLVFPISALILPKREMTLALYAMSRIKNAEK